MKAIVIYNSQTGFTKRYAEWIAEELGCEAVPWKRRTSVDLGSYDLTIFGSWIHASSITGSKWAKEQIASHPEKKFAFFTVGSSPVKADGSLDEKVKTTFDSEFSQTDYPNLSCFYLPGGFAYEKLGLPDKLIMKVLFSQVDKIAESDPEGAALFKRMQEGFDETARENITSIINYAHAL